MARKRAPSEAPDMLSGGRAVKRLALERIAHPPVACIPVMILLIQNGFCGPFSVANVELASHMEEHLASRQGRYVARRLRKAFFRLMEATYLLDVHYGALEYVEQVRCLEDWIERDTRQVIVIHRRMKALARQEGGHLRLLTLLRAGRPVINRVMALHAHMFAFLIMISDEIDHGQDPVFWNLFHKRLASYVKKTIAVSRPCAAIRP